MFDKLVEKVNREIVSFLNKGSLPIAENTQVKEAKLPESDAKKLSAGREEVGSNRRVGGQTAPNSPIRVEKKVGRNDPCPCGSGKKYKNCHGLENA